MSKPTLSLKKAEAQPDQSANAPKKPKQPPHWRNLTGSTVRLRYLDGTTVVGKLIAVTQYEVVIEHDDDACIAVAFKHGLASVTGVGDA
jgi:hypothetical protein